MSKVKIPVFLLLVAPFFVQGDSSELEVWGGAAESYETRRATPLNETERKLVGKFSGGNAELKWEIHRHEDGTFDLVMLQPLEGGVMEDYTKGIWGVEGERYYFVDLECLNRSPGGEPERFWEQIRSITDDRFETVSKGVDREELISPEIRVEAFRMPFWKQLPDA